MVQLFQHDLFFHYFQSDKLFLLFWKVNESVALATLIWTILPLSFTAGISLQYYHKVTDDFE